MMMPEVNPQEKEGILCENGYEALSTYCFYEEKSCILRIQKAFFDGYQHQEKKPLTLIPQAFFEVSERGSICQLVFCESSYDVFVPSKERAQAIVEILERECFGKLYAAKEKLIRSLVRFFNKMI